MQSAHSKLCVAPRFIRSMSYDVACSDLIACFGLNPSGSANTCPRVCPVNIQREPVALSFLSVRLSVDLIVNVICWCTHNMKPPGFTGRHIKSEIYTGVFVCVYPGSNLAVHGIGQAGHSEQQPLTWRPHCIPSESSRTMPFSIPLFISPGSLYLVPLCDA